jgi:DNA polymerase-3 subunit delta
MVALKGQQVERFIERPDPGIRAVLLFGPEAGLVTLRADALVERLSGGDREACTRLDGDVIAGEPGRLAEEAHALDMFRPVRVLRVRETGRSLAPAVAQLLERPSAERVVIVEAGDLKPNAPLRKAMEKDRAAAVIGCYPDDNRSLGAYVDEVVRRAGLSLDEEAREALVAQLGADRLQSATELDKLITYVHPEKSIRLADVEAVVSDVSAGLRDSLADAVAGRERGEVVALLRRAAAEGLPVSVLLSGVLRHFADLANARARLDDGEAAGTAVNALGPVHFRRRARVEAQLRRWSGEALRDGTVLLRAAELDARRHPDLALEIVERTLLRLCSRS